MIQDQEHRELVLSILMIISLLAACIAMPIIVFIFAGNWWGVATAALAIPTWIYFGPPPMPGFLNGLIALGGLVSITGIGIGLLIRTLT